MNPPFAWMVTFRGRARGTTTRLRSDTSVVELAAKEEEDEEREAEAVPKLEEDDATGMVANWAAMVETSELDAPRRALSLSPSLSIRIHSPFFLCRNFTD